MRPSYTKAELTAAASVTREAIKREVQAYAERNGGYGNAPKDAMADAYLFFREGDRQARATRNAEAKVAAAEADSKANRSAA